MNLNLVRKWKTTESTIGELSIDGIFECYILEPAGQKAILEGTYPVVITYSPRFRRQLPLLEGVPGRSGIRIHPGNTAADTDGCPLPGQTRGADWVGRSRAAFDLLFAKLKTAQLGKSDISITITSDTSEETNG